MYFESLFLNNLSAKLFYHFQKEGDLLQRNPNTPIIDEFQSYSRTEGFVRHGEQYYTNYDKPRIRFDELKQDLGSFDYVRRAKDGIEILATRPTGSRTELFICPYTQIEFKMLVIPKQVLKCVNNFFKNRVEKERP